MFAARILVLALGACALAGAQNPATAMEDALSRQRASIEKQRASVQKQVPLTGETANSFFTVPWKDPLPPPPIVLYRPPECDPVSEDEIGPIVEDMSSREGLTPDLLHAVIEKESAYLPCAISTKGAQGLMQLMPDTAAQLGVTDPLDARQNVEGGAHYLKGLMDRYGGNLVLALAAYNAGPGRVDAAGGVPNLPETLQYVSGIMKRLGLQSPELAAH